MKKVLICAVAAAVSVTSLFAQTKAKVKPVVKTGLAPAPAKSIMKNLNDSFSYAAGFNIASSMKQQGITHLNTALMQKAVDDVLNNKTLLLTQEQANITLQEQLQIFAMKKGAVEKEKGLAYLAENKKRKGVIVLPSGLQYEILKSGEANGIKPTAADTVVVDYVGTLIDGVEFDNSIKRGEPATFPLGRVIKGWTDILQLMSKGDKWKVFIPSELGYGERGFAPTIPGNATLIFEIELKDINPAVKQ